MLMIQWPPVAPFQRPHDFAKWLANVKASWCKNKLPTSNEINTHRGVRGYLEVRTPQSGVYCNPLESRRGLRGALTGTWGKSGATPVRPATCGRREGWGRWIRYPRGWWREYLRRKHVQNTAWDFPSAPIRGEWLQRPSDRIDSIDSPLTTANSLLSRHVLHLHNERQPGLAV